MRIVVIGGGIVGRLVQHQHPTARIFDWRPRPPLHQKLALTRNYGANYLWEPIPGIPCVEFTVHTFIDGALPTNEAMAAYKKKIGRANDPPNWGQFRPVMVGYDFVELPEPRISFGCKVLAVNLSQKKVHIHSTEPASLSDAGEVPYDVLVSTIPLSSFLPMVGLKVKHTAFPFRPIYIKVVSRDALASIPGDWGDEAGDWTVNYCTDPNNPVYRQTWRGNEVHLECLDAPTSTIGYKRIVPGKIYNPPQHEAYRQEALAYLRERDIYTFGRFGSWATDELLHETWKDIVERTSHWG